MRSFRDAIRRSAVMLAAATGAFEREAKETVSDVVMSFNGAAEAAAAMSEAMRETMMRNGLSLRYDGGEDIIVSAAVAELDPPLAPSGRAGFERAIRMASKRRTRGRRSAR